VVATDPPDEFGPEFLHWLREATESAWQQVEEPSLEDFERAGFIGALWRRGTRWTGGLDDQIRARMDDVSDTSRFAEGIAHYGGRRWLPGGPCPQLIPIYAHRYVIGDDSQWVLSIVGGDAIVYGADLRGYLLAELRDVVGQRD
jgi:hypothetical protein